MLQVPFNYIHFSLSSSSSSYPVGPVHRVFWFVSAAVWTKLSAGYFFRKRLCDVRYSFRFQKLPSFVRAYAYRSRGTVAKLLRSVSSDQECREVNEESMPACGGRRIYYSSYYIIIGSRVFTSNVYTFFFSTPSTKQTIIELHWFVSSVCTLA